MKNIRDYLKNDILIADGAASTYLSSVAGRGSDPCEVLNLSQPEIVMQMHRQYIKAGAKLIFTNTFAAGSIGDTPETGIKIIRAGIDIALKASENKAYAAADIGPLPEASLDHAELFEKYMKIADTFIDNGISIFVFETFASPVYPIKISEYIKSRLPHAFTAISFSVTPDGYSRENISGAKLISDVVRSGCADAAGFNCYSGPAHLLGYAKNINYGELTPLIMPNAGYPQRESGDLPVQELDVTYSGSPKYFASMLSSAAEYGFRIIGGCCGTTPLHINMLSREVERFAGTGVRTCSQDALAFHKERMPNAFSSALKNGGRKTVVVELEPPVDTDTSKLQKSALAVKETGVDAVTVADSPMARARADSLTTAAWLKRDFGLEAIPHMCCRDKNLNAIKSSLISAHINGIRNILTVTGDPIPDTDKGMVKGVFNVNSEGLCNFIRSLNNGIFKGDEMFYGCAFNVNAKNIDAEILRLDKKIAAGASFVLTQPVFTAEAADALKKVRNKGVEIIAGLMTPVNYRNAVFLANEMPGFKVPRELLERFSPDMTRRQGETEGINITVEIARNISDMADGFYFIIPFNRAHVVKEVIDRLRAEGII